MFSTVSRALKGPVPNQIFTPDDFDKFLSTKIFHDKVPVKRLHVVADMKELLGPHFNKNTKGLGHQGWRAGQIMKSQRVRALERLKTEKPELFAQMIKSKSLIIPDAQAEFVLEDFDILLEMCRGHDGKNPNHVIRFVKSPTSNKCFVQYKHFCFDDQWRPNLSFNKVAGQWEPNSSVSYSWFAPETDFEMLLKSTPTTTRPILEIEQSVYDNVAKCVGTMSNFSRHTMANWDQYFECLNGLRTHPMCTIPILSIEQLCRESEKRPQLSDKLSNSNDSGRPSTLRLTSIYGSNSRESLVASDPADSQAWSNDMEDMRQTPRVIRVQEDGDHLFAFVSCD